MHTTATATSPFDTPLMLGMMRLLDYPDLCEPARLAAWIEARLEQGLSWFDHANIYGNGQCEWLFGKALEQAPALKERVRVVTKANIVPAQSDGSGWSVKHYNAEADYLQGAIDTALQRLQVPRLDCFLLHRPDPLMQVEETARALEDAVKAGKVAAVGVSNFLPEQWRLLRETLRVPVVCNQIELSLLATQSLFDGTLEAHQRDGLQVLAWSPFAGGRLGEGGIADTLQTVSVATGVSVDALAIAWLRRIPGAPIPVMGSCNETRIGEALKGANYPMPRAVWYKLLEAARGHRVA